MKRILIIGAGFLQTFVIKKAKELGYYTIAVDGNPDAEGFSFCDEYKVVDIVDYNACLEYAIEMKIDGVLTAATDYGVVSMAYIGDKLNLPAINLKSAECIKNKYQVRKILSGAGADDTADYYEITNTKNLSNIKEMIKYPVMVKPCDGSGSRGTTKVESEMFLENACKLAISNSVTSKALIEPFIENGQEYGAESFVYKNEVYVLGIMKKFMTKPPYYAELGHAIPSGLGNKMETKVKKCVTKAIKALGINHGSVNMDILITKDETVHIIDVGARMGGNLIGSHIIPLGSGVDYMGNMIKAAVGDSVCFNPIEKPQAVATRMLALSPGVVKKLPDFELLSKQNNIIIEHHIKVGDIINEYRTNLDGVGYVVCEDKVEATATQRALDFKNIIDVSIVRA